MSNVNDELIQKITEYKKEIHELEVKTLHAPDDEKKEYAFKLTDLKAKLSLAESELKNT